MTKALLILIAMWLGAALIVVASVAPAAFAVLPSRTLAGALVGRVLPVLFYSAMAIALASLAVFGTGRFLRAVPSLLMFAGGFLAQFEAAPKIAKLRAEIGTAIESLPVGDPQRELFGKLHGMSVAYLGFSVVSATILVVMLLLAMRQRNP